MGAYENQAKLKSAEKRLTKRNPWSIYEGESTRAQEQELTVSMGEFRAKDATEFYRGTK